MKPKLLIWDWNGTIIDDTDLCIEIENELLRERSMREITKDWYLAHFTFPVRDYYLEMGYTFQSESFETVAGIFMERYRVRCTECRLRTGVADVLLAARERGIVQTLLSVTRQNDLIEQAEAFGVAGFFSEILGQDDSLCVSKVERARRYMRRLGMNPKETLFIGDTAHDVKAANAVGCPCVLLENGHQSREALLRCGVPVYDSAETLKRELFS